MRRRLSRGTIALISANALALAALVAATGGTSWAAALVGTNRLADGAVTTAKLRDGAVTSRKIAAGSVGTVRISGGAITSGKLRDGAVTAAKIAQGAVRARQLATGAVDKAAVATGAIGTEELKNGEVRNADLAEKAVGKANLTKKLLASKWANADKIDGLDSSDLVTKTTDTAVYGERTLDIEIPLANAGQESSVARIDSTAIKGDVLVIARISLAYPVPADAKGVVRCRLFLNSRSRHPLTVVGFEKVAAGNIMIGAGQVVLTDQVQFPVSGRNTIDMRCSSSLDGVLAQDMSIMAVRVSDLRSATLT